MMQHLLRVGMTFDQADERFGLRLPSPLKASTVSTSPALIRSLRAFWKASRRVVLEIFLE